MEGVSEQLGLNTLIFHRFSENESSLMQLKNSIIYICINEEKRKEIAETLNQMYSEYFFK